MRYKEVVQPGNVREWCGQIKRWLTIRREKSAILGRMLIIIHPYMERRFYLRNRSTNGHNQAVGRRVTHGEATSFSESRHRLIVLGCGTELPGELFDTEKVTIVGAGWVVEPVQKAGQLALVA